MAKRSSYSTKKTKEKDKVELPPPLRRRYQSSLTRSVFGNRLLCLLLALILLLVGYPFFIGGPFEGFALTIFFSVVVIAGIYAVSHDRIHLLITVLLGIPTIIAQFFAYFQNELSYMRLYEVLSVLFLSYVAITILLHVITVRHVTYNTFCGAICVFLFIGLIWGGLYMLVESMNPGSLEFHDSQPKTWSTMMYYSFMTLTTVGYGDITPVSAIVQSLAILEAVIGLFFTAVLIARLMGLSLNGSR